MAVKYTKLFPIKSFGGPDEKHEGGYLISQSQHVLADEDVILVSMLDKRNVRVINSKDGTFKCDVSKMGFKDGEFEMAAGMSFYKDDQVLVTDLTGNKILSFSKSDLSFIGLPLSSYEFDKPYCIRNDVQDNIYVGEVGDESRKLKCFDVNLKEKFTISQAGDYSILGVNYVSIDERGNRILLTDSDGNTVHVFTKDGLFEFSIWESGSELGELTYPTGTAVDNEGNILVCDTGNSRIQVFDRDGKFVSIFGDKDTFISPMDIYITENEEIVVVDGSVCSGWSRVQIFKY